MTAAAGVPATLISPEGRRDETLAAISSLQTASADEPGTTLFAIHEHRDEAGTFSVFERYEDDAAVQAHRSSPAMQDLRDALVDRDRSAIRPPQHPRITRFSRIPGQTGDGCH